VREVVASARAPADAPGLVGDLWDLPTGRISKIAAGGCVLAAVTTGNDMYCWGGHPGRPSVLEDISANPTPVVVGEADVQDVAVGDSHMVVLTDQGEVFGIGDNENGQLGLGREQPWAKSWTRIPLPLGGRSRVSRVAAGPRSSFLIVQEQK